MIYKEGETYYFFDSSTYLINPIEITIGDIDTIDVELNCFEGGSMHINDYTIHAIVDSCDRSQFVVQFPEKQLFKTLEEAEAAQRQTLRREILKCDNSIEELKKTIENLEHELEKANELKEDLSWSFSLTDIVGGEIETLTTCIKQLKESLKLKEENLRELVTALIRT